MTDQKIIPDAAAWYVRTGLDRAISFQLDAIRDRLDMIDECIAKGLPKMPYLSLYNMTGYDFQWLSEALDAYATLPADVIPVQISGWDLKKTNERILELKATWTTLGHSLKGN